MERSRVWMVVGFIVFSLPVFANAANNKNLADIRSKLAIEYAKLGNYKVAMENADQAIRADSAVAEPYLAKAYINLLLGQNKDAEDNFLRALSIEPGNSEANNNYGLFLCENGRVKESQDYFNRALSNPLYTEPQAAYLNLARCSAKLHENQQANDYLLTALKIAPNFIPALETLSALQLDMGNAKLAAFYFERIRRQTTALSSQQLWLGVRIARKSGDQASEGDLGQALKSHYPDSRETQLLLSGN